MRNANNFHIHKDAIIFLLCLFMSCIISTGISGEIDSDEDGLPDDFEINVSKTDPNTFSTDGDPYGDKEEFYGLNIPEMIPADHPLVAAYPNLNVYLERIEVIPKSTISTATGKTKNDAWTITTETSDEVKTSTEVGAELKTKIGGQDKFGVEIAGHVTHIAEDTYATTDSKSNSGFNQEDWSTAISSSTDQAADLKLTLSIENSGTITAYDVIPDVNIKLGEKIVATFTSPTAIDSLGIGERKIFLVDQGVVGAYPVDLTVSLDQLRSIDSGTPLSIETLQTRCSIKKYGGGWVTEDYSLYTDEIAARTATLMYRSKDGEYKEYKVYAANTKVRPLLDPITLGDAITLTIGKDILERGDEELDFGFFPQEAFDDSRKLIDKNESILNLKMKPGWRIFIKEPGWEPSAEPPVIHWANVAEDKNLKTFVHASVTDVLGSVKVVAHVKVNDIYQDLPMSDIDQDTIYELIVNEAIDGDGDHYINATNAEGYSAQLKFSSPKKPVFKDGKYIFSAKNSSLYMAGNTGNNVDQDYFRGDSNQTWVLSSDGTGFYSIENSYKNEYLNGNEDDIEAIKNPGMKNQWNIEPVGDGYYKISNIQSSKCLTGTKDGSIVLDDYIYSDSQNWTIQPAESFPNENLLTLNLPVDFYIFIGEASKKCWDLDLSDNTVYEEDHYSDEFQKWGLTPVGDGYFKIFCLGNNRCLEITNSTNNDSYDGSQIVAENDYHGGDNQKWYFKNRDDGYYNICSKVISKNGIICLTGETSERLANFNFPPLDLLAGPITIVKSGTLHNNKNQRWKLLPVTKAAIYADKDYVRYYLQLKGVNDNRVPILIKTDNTKFELIPLGKDIGTDIVAIKNINSPGFIHLVSYTDIYHKKKKFIFDVLAKDEKKSYTIWYTSGGSAYLDDVLDDASYRFRLRNNEGEVTIDCENRYIQLIEGEKYQPQLSIEARHLEQPTTYGAVGSFNFEHLT